MYIKIKAVLKTPLMIGGKTLNSNYKKSRDYIPGSVLRAAFARELIQACPYPHENNWLSCKKTQECSNCRFCGLCRNFSNIKFPALYLLGGKPYPATARIDKYGEKETKEIRDIMKSRLKNSSPGEEEENWEKLQGFYKEGKQLKAIYQTITRTAIDYTRHTAKNNALFTQNTVAGLWSEETGQSMEAVFAGETELFPNEMEEIKKIDMLHIGANTTAGMGLCEMQYEETEATDTLEEMESRIQMFQHEEGDDYVLSVDLLSDAYLQMEELKGDSGEVADEEFLKFLEQRIGLPREFHLIKVFKNQDVLRGFDTSRPTEREMRRKPQIVVKAGAVFVYKVKKEKLKENLEGLLKIEQTGIGKNTLHGFGKVRICDEFHEKYDVVKRRR